MAKSPMVSTDEHKIAPNLQTLIRLQYVARGLPLGESQVVKSLLVGRHRSNVRGRGMNFEELRHYRVGDDIRQMDWKVTNRTKKPHVRVYAEERERPVLILVDQCRSMFFGSRRAMKSVAAAEMAALIAWNVVQGGDRIGMLIYDDHSCTEVRPRRSQFQIMQMLNLLCDYGNRLRTASAAAPPQLNAMLRRAKNLAGHDALIYVVSDLDGANEETGELLTQLAQHNNITLSFVYDPLEKVLPRGGRLAVSDGKYQVEVDTEDKNLRARYESFFAERLAQIQDFLHRRKIPILPISTHTPVEQQLLKMLGNRSNT